jgi:hypothetical protein
MARETALYCEALQDLDPRHLTHAVTTWLRDGTRWPLPAEIRKLAIADAERDEAAQAGVQAQIADQCDLGAELRNEAINILGPFDVEARRHCGGGNTDAYRVFLGEAARWWEGYRPPGGLRELDSQRGGRFRVGHAMEAWARQRLRLPAPDVAPREHGTNPVAELTASLRAAE